MGIPAQLTYKVQNQMELNFSYMPFINNGGLFVPTNEKFELDDNITVELHLPGQTDSIYIEGRVVWITPVNALYQIYPGVGIQFTGDKAKALDDLIKSHLDNTMDVGGHAYGMMSTTT